MLFAHRDVFIQLKHLHISHMIQQVFCCCFNACFTPNIHQCWVLSMCDVYNHFHDIKYDSAISRRVSIFFFYFSLYISHQLTYHDYSIAHSLLSRHFRIFEYEIHKALTAHQLACINHLRFSIANAVKFS